MQDDPVRELHAKFCEVWTFMEHLVKKTKSCANSAIFKSSLDTQKISFCHELSECPNLTKNCMKFTHKGILHHNF